MSTGCAFCGREHGLEVLGMRDEGMQVHCAWCGALGPEGADEAEAWRAFGRRPRESAAVGVAALVVVTALVVLLLMGRAAHAARRGLERELDEARALTEAVESRAWERGWQAGKAWETAGAVETD